MKRAPSIVLTVLFLTAVGLWLQFHRAAHQPPSAGTSWSTATTLPKPTTNWQSLEPRAVSAGARPSPAEAATHLPGEVTARPPATSVSREEISRLITSYRAETDPDRKHAIGRHLAKQGDATVVELFAQELLADYGGAVLPKKEGLRMCSIPALLGLLGRHEPGARKILLQGLDPAFWNGHITWSVAGESAVELLVRACIGSVSVCEDEKAWAALLAFRNRQSVRYLFHFSGSFMDAACDRYWTKQRGRNYLQSRSMEQHLEDIGVWRETPDGKSWLAWEDRVRAQWEASTPQVPPAKP